jgi:hypothetical protein
MALVSARPFDIIVGYVVGGIVAGAAFDGLLIAIDSLRLVSRVLRDSYEIIDMMVLKHNPTNSFDIYRSRIVNHILRQMLKIKKETVKKKTNTNEEDVRSYKFDEKTNEDYSKEYFNNYFILERKKTKLSWIKSNMNSRQVFKIMIRGGIFTFLILYKVKSKAKTFLPLLFLKTIENNKKVTPDTQKLLKIDISKK